MQRVGQAGVLEAAREECVQNAAKFSVHLTQTPTSRGGGFTGTFSVCQADVSPRSIAMYKKSPPLTAFVSSSTRQAGAGTLREREEARAVVTSDKVGAEGAEAVATETGTGNVGVGALTSYSASKCPPPCRIMQENPTQGRDMSERTESFPCFYECNPIQAEYFRPR